MARKYPSLKRAMRKEHVTAVDICKTLHIDPVRPATVYDINAGKSREWRLWEMAQIHRVHFPDYDTCDLFDIDEGYLHDAAHEANIELDAYKYLLNW